MNEGFSEGEMETDRRTCSQQALHKDVEGKERRCQTCRSHLWLVALGLVLLSLTLCIFSLKYFWSPGPRKVYKHQYKVLLDGVEMDSVMEIDPNRLMEMFKVGNGSDEVLEVHDFKNGLTGIRFAKHQRCYIRPQPRDLPEIAELDVDHGRNSVDETLDPQVEDMHEWIPAEEPIADHTFLLNSKIWEICNQMPIHWMHPSAKKETKIHELEDAEESPGEETRGQRQARDVMDYQPVNDYRDVGIELENQLDENGYCCQHCRRGYRFCRRYHEPLGGYWPYPYYYQGGRVICQVVMPCNWWIARMLGRI
uniref:Tenomodulin n=1 Tax=Paramormyrops kingsleyae TaxID=1676925 RepID=A0A3B3QER1_9TELE|nr:tenomodulin [Paramormyrops kingsleyae]